MEKYKYKLYGAILGDLAGQPYEFPVMQGPYTNINIHNPDSKFTDDTIMTLASAAHLVDKKMFPSPEVAYRSFGNVYSGDFYGKSFKEWLKAPSGTINTSYGNGCLMRISPFMYMEEGLPIIMESVMCSHKCQISLESAVRLYNKYKNGLFDYNKLPIYITPFSKFEIRADKTVEFCLNLVSQTHGTKNCIIKAISCGGDTDTNASICGELSNYYKKDITEEDARYVESKLDSFLLGILKEFNEKF